MKITMYELYGKIYDENPPKHIQVYDEDWYWNDYDGYVTKESLKTTPDAQIYLMDRYRTFMNLDKEVEIIEENPTVEKLEDRIEKALEFLETQYNTYPNGEMWRGALKNILQGKSADDVYEPFIEDNKKLEKIDFKTLNTQKEKNRAMKDAINELIDVVNKLKESKQDR